jgi:HlyD family secretion protein/epimerase transport system membrane fusion protein
MPQQRLTQDEQSVRLVRRYAAIGIGAIIFGCGAFLAWAIFSPLASGVVSGGTVVVESQRKVVQHPEGGIISAILVRDGEYVAAGQLLMKLDSLESHAAVDLLRIRWLTLLAEECRLLALVDNGAGDFEMSPTLAAEASQADAARIILRQRRLLDSSKSAMNSQLSMIDQRIAQQHSKIRALQGQIAKGDEQISLIQAELTDAQELYAKKLERRSRVLLLQRQTAYLEGQQSDYEGQIAAAKEVILEAGLEQQKVRSDLVKESAASLNETSAQRVEVEEKLRAAAAQLTRREILAPQAGTVLNLKFATVGGVISPSEPIMEIVPSEERLVIDGKVSPRDVDQLRLGLTAEVMFVGLNRRTTPMLRGRVIDISADILEDTQSGRPYFTVRIELPDSEIARLGEQKIQPGMPTQLVILTGDRTPMDYILSPLRESLMIAMREG